MTEDGQEGEDDDQEATRAEAEACSAVMRQGSALVYTGRTVHGAGHNQTNTPVDLMFCDEPSKTKRRREGDNMTKPPPLPSQTFTSFFILFLQLKPPFYKFSLCISIVEEIPI